MMKHRRLVIGIILSLCVFSISGCHDDKQDETGTDTLVIEETASEVPAYEPTYAPAPVSVSEPVPEPTEVPEITSEPNGMENECAGAVESESETVSEEMKEPEVVSTAIPEQTETPLIEVPMVTVEGIEPVTLYATTSLNVRREPYAGADKVGVLSVGETVTADGISDNGWYRFMFDGSEAYASGSYLSKEEPKPAPEPAASATGLVEVLGNVDSIWVEKADRQLARIPQNARDHFVAAGYHFYVTDEDIGTTEFGGSIGRVAGATKYGQYIKIEDRQYAIDEAAIHEFGHFVFDACGDWSRQDVADAFSADVGNAASMGITYGLDNISEFYAEVFQKYIKDRGTTSQTFPNLSAIIQGDLDSL